MDLDYRSPEFGSLRDQAQLTAISPATKIEVMRERANRAAVIRLDASAVRHIDCGFGRLQNCVSVALAVDSWLSGATRPATREQNLPLSHISRRFPGHAWRTWKIDELENRMKQWGDGAKGIACWTSSQGNHAINLTNILGTIYIIDAVHPAEIARGFDEYFAGKEFPDEIDFIGTSGMILR